MQRIQRTSHTNQIMWLILCIVFICWVNILILMLYNFHVWNKKKNIIFYVFDIIRWFFFIWRLIIYLTSGDLSFIYRASDSFNSLSANYSCMRVQETAYFLTEILCTQQPISYYNIKCGWKFPWKSHIQPMLQIWAELPLWRQKNPILVCIVWKCARLNGDHPVDSMVVQSAKMMDHTLELELNKLNNKFSPPTPYLLLQRR